MATQSIYLEHHNGETMKLHTPKMINSRLEKFYVLMIKLANERSFGFAASRLPDQEKLHKLHRQLCDSIYCKEEKGCKWHGKVKEAAIKCGLEFVGAGRERMTVKTTYYSKEIVIKLCSDGSGYANENEIYNIERASSVKHRVGLVLEPSISWTSSVWGLVVGFPNCPIINNGDWSFRAAKRGEWEDSKLDEEHHTKEVQSRISKLCAGFMDIHEWNIGMMNNTLYLIDCDLN
jgi:hypothetical protein